MARCRLEVTWLLEDPRKPTATMQQRALTWMAVIAALGGMDAGPPAGGEDARLAEVRAAFDEATRLKDSGKYADAVQRAERALAVRETLPGDGTPDVASCLNLLGNLYRLRGDLARAEPLLRRALELREASPGKVHVDVAQSLNTLAVLYWSKGQYEQAEPLYKRALAIRETALGSDHPSVADSLSNLAVLYTTQGLFHRAEQCHERALAIREAKLGENHPDVADSLHNFGILHNILGSYGRGEQLLRRALAIRESVLGKDHHKVADSLVSLANIYYAQGLHDRAAPLLDRSLAIRESTQGKNHPDVATTLNNLANVHMAQGRYGRAELLLQRALAIRESALGKSHPDVATTLHNLVNIHMAQGLYARSEPLVRRALSNYESAVGENHPRVALLLSDLAELAAAQGLYDQAESLHERALAIREAVLGPSHPDVAASLNALARLHLARRHLASALPLLARAFTLSEARLRKEALDFSESRREGFLQHLRADEERLYALLRAYPADAHVQRLALAAALLLKGRSAEEIAGVSRTISRSLSVRDREAFERLRGLRTRLAERSFGGPGKLTSESYQQLLKELTEQGDAIEADLAGRSAPLRSLTALPTPADIVDSVVAALPRDSVLVEVISYRERWLAPGRSSGSPSQVSSRTGYLTLLLFPDGRIRAIDLGSAAPIDSAASRLRDALASRDAAYQRHAQALHALVIRPLLPYLADIRRLLLAPDGQLGLVPFHALQDSGARTFLIDAFDFTYLTSGRDLLPRPETISPSRSVAIFADPDFNGSSAASSSGGKPAPSGRSSPGTRGASTRADRGDRPWVPLPGTRQEAQALHRLFPRARLFLGPDASKAHLLQLEVPGILHIATHGFFLEDPVDAPGTRAVAELGPLGGGDPTQPLPDPLLRSGLILAVSPVPGEPSPPQLDASRVTALELAGLDLWGSQLVVLSACDTGRGEVKLGQGVYGLRRALIVAGAETVVMSLWKVDDETTRHLMEGYYRNLLAGQGRSAALREAMLGLREKQPHPYYWAPFLALGQDGPLRAMTSAPP